MKLDIRQSYLAMFHMLEKIYKESEDENFASLLSGFDPFLFTDGMSADPAAWGDWNNVVKKISANNHLTSFEALNATKEFIKFHQDEFGFELDWVVARLSRISINNLEWLDCVSKALVVK